MLTQVAPSRPQQHLASIRSGPGVTALTRRECMARLEGGGVGRVGVTLDALPVVLPVRYGLLGEQIVFRVGEGTRLLDAVRGAVVAFEADAVVPESGAAWYVSVTGRAAPLSLLAAGERLVVPGTLLDDDGPTQLIGLRADVIAGAAREGRS